MNRYATKHTVVTTSGDQIKIQSVRSSHSPTWIVKTYSISKDGKELTSARQLNKVLCEAGIQYKDEELNSYLLTDTERYTEKHHVKIGGFIDSTYFKALGVLELFNDLDKLGYNISIRDKAKNEHIRMIKAKPKQEQSA
jgi:hypothetical protein